MQIEPNDLPPAHWEGKSIIRHVSNNEMRSWAIYSQDELYRYRLRRVWAKGRRIAFLMLNPSTATETQNDPTVERCERRARALGYGGFEVVNIFALRSTDPAQLYKSVDPIGVDNDQAIKDAVASNDALLCAWGNHGLHLKRSDAVKTLLIDCQKPIFYLSLTKLHQPKHPLYVGYTVEPELWQL